MPVIRTVLFLLLVSVFIGVVSAAEIPVCIRSSDQVNPDIDGDHVA